MIFIYPLFIPVPGFHFLVLNKSLFIIDEIDEYVDVHIPASLRQTLKRKHRFSFDETIADSELRFVELVSAFFVDFSVNYP